MAPVVSLTGVGKRFRRRDPRRPNTLKGLLAAWPPWGHHRAAFWPFRDLSLDIEPGESLGVIGPNGAGKTSLLRVIGGLLPADEGCVRVNGRLGALLDLGAGFSGDLSGRENALFNGIVAGLTRREIEQRMDAIVEFAELQRSIDEPLRTYSAGMKLRLAFAVSVHTEPEVLLVDEVLAVGDVGFQKRCIERVDAMRAQGCAVVLVSHEPELVRRHCGRVLWLRPDDTPVLGPAEAVTREFVASFFRETQRRSASVGGVRTLPGGTRLELGANRMGSLEVEVTQVTLNDQTSEHVHLGAGGRLTLDVHYVRHAAAQTMACTVTLLRDGHKLIASSVVCGAEHELPLRDAGVLQLDLLRLELSPGQYDVEVGLYPADYRYAYDYHWNVYRVLVDGQATAGYLQVPAVWREQTTPASARRVRTS